MILMERLWNAIKPWNILASLIFFIKSKGILKLILDTYEMPCPVKQAVQRGQQLISVNMYFDAIGDEERRNNALNCIERLSEKLLW